MPIDEVRTWLESRDRTGEARAFEREFGVFGKLERRTFSHSVGQTRMAGTSDTALNDGTLQIVGHAAVFGKPSVEMASPFGAFTEYIDARAFDDVLKENPDVLLTWDHDTRYTLGRTGNNTLDLTTDTIGLRYWSRVAPTSYATDLKVLMDGGYLNQSSFLFRVAKGGEDWTVSEDEQGNEIVSRTIYVVSDLFDVCVCAAGAYPQTDSGVARSLAVEYAIGSGFMSTRKAIPFGETPLAAKDSPWDASAEVKSASVDDLMAMCTWYDPEKKTADGTLTKDAFKLPHHEAGGDHEVVWDGVKAAMSRLNQSNTQIPEADKQAVYNHLKKHYGEFDENPPELRTRVEIDAEARRVSDEFRALGDVAWGPNEGVDDLMCELEEVLNMHSMFYSFSVIDLAVTLDKAIIVDWDDYSFWVVPFVKNANGVVPADRTEWVQVETAWVTTAEGYEANIRSAKIRREARMADTTEVETPAEPAAEEAEAAAAAEATAAEAAEAEAVEVPEVAEAAEVTAAEETEAPADEVAEKAARSAKKARLLAEARVRIAHARTV